MLASVLSTYVLTVLLFLLMPGPVNLAVVQAVARNGLRGGWCAVLGSNTASLVLIGLAVLLMHAGGSVHAQFMEVLSVLGGAYLLYYGWEQWRERQHSQTPAPVVAEECAAAKQPVVHSDWQIARSAFAVGISNPKDIIFFMTFFPPFVTQLPLSFGQAMLVLVALWCVLDYAILLAYALGVNALLTPRRQILLHSACAVLFMVIGLYAMLRLLWQE